MVSTRLDCKRCMRVCTERNSFPKCNIQLFAASIRVCNGSRYWVEDPRIEPLPEEECAAYGQEQYRTFDGKWITFEGINSCQYELMSIKNTAHTITISNEECKDTWELVMCKNVLIETEKGTVELIQKDIRVTPKHKPPMDYNPGNYPQPCQSSSLPYTEIFSRGVFTVVRVFNPQDPFQPLYEVS